MPIPIPNLDNREFEDLFEEIRALIPRYNKEWTNLNTSDPGIALLELFAYFAEQTQYRVNQVPRENYEAYLSLLGISIGPTEDLSVGVQQAINLINERYRAVTAADYEELTLERMDQLEPGLAGRAIVINNADLRNIGTGADTLEDVAREGNVSVIIVPRCDNAALQAWCEPGDLPVPNATLLGEIQTLLEERRLITTRVHAAAPAYRKVDMTARIVLKDNTDETTVTTAARNRIAAFLDPLDGGPEGQGWPAGRPIYRSEYFQILEGTPGVDHVVEAVLNADGEDPDNDVVLRPWELVEIQTNQVTAAEE